DAETYFQFLIRFNIFGWLLKDIVGEQQTFSKDNIIEVIIEMDKLWKQYKDTLTDEKTITIFKMIMEVFVIHARNLKYKDADPKVMEILKRMFMILEGNMRPYKDLKDAISATWTIRVMTIRLAHLLGIKLEKI
ncbi:unnamed protein product, partial [Meganyctiphanes norvegica]